METLSADESSTACTGSYRTYEEWKQPFESDVTSVCKRSYRTYEEWKHQYGSTPGTLESRSYRTYEEWKRGEINETLQEGLVLTVPMRNGN